LNDESSGNNTQAIYQDLHTYSLGELEAQVLDVVWNLEPPITASQVFKHIYPRRELSYSAITLTMAKLAKKGLLRQEKSGIRKTEAFLYTPVMTREMMARKLMESISQQVFRKPLREVLRDMTE